MNLVESNIQRYLLLNQFTMKRILIIRPDTAQKILNLPVRNKITMTVSTLDKLIKPKGNDKPLIN